MKYQRDLRECGASITTCPIDQGKRVLQVSGCEFTDESKMQEYVEDSHSGHPLTMDDIKLEICKSKNNMRNRQMR